MSVEVSAESVIHSDTHPSSILSTAAVVPLHAQMVQGIDSHGNMVQYYLTGPADGSETFVMPAVIEKDGLETLAAISDMPDEQVALSGTEARSSSYPESDMPGVQGVLINSTEAQGKTYPYPTQPDIQPNTHKQIRHGNIMLSPDACKQHAMPQLIQVDHDMHCDMEYNVQPEPLSQYISNVDRSSPSDTHSSHPLADSDTAATPHPLTDDIECGLVDINGQTFTIVKQEDNRTVYEGDALSVLQQNSDRNDQNSSLELTQQSTQASTDCQDEGNVENVGVALGCTYICDDNGMLTICHAENNSRYQASISQPRRIICHPDDSLTVVEHTQPEPRIADQSKYLEYRHDDTLENVKTTTDRVILTQFLDSDESTSYRVKMESVDSEVIFTNADWSPADKPVNMVNYSLTNAGEIKLNTELNTSSSSLNTPQPKIIINSSPSRIRLKTTQPSTHLTPLQTSQHPNTSPPTIRLKNS